MDGARGALWAYVWGYAGLRAGGKQGSLRTVGTNGFVGAMFATRRGFARWTDAQQGVDHGMAEKTPERLTWAVGRLGLSGEEAVLEIGCGRGVAVSLVCSLLQGGQITAIDRSATAVKAATERNAASVVAGKAILRHAAIEDFDAEASAFDTIFAVNVNLFWLDAGRGLDAVRRLLRGNGQLFLFYEAPSPGQRAKIAEILPEKLAAGGFEVLDTEAPGQSCRLAVVARVGGG